MGQTGLFCFRRICFPNLIYCGQRGMITIFGVYKKDYQLDLRFVSLLDCLQTNFYLKSLSFYLKSYGSALKLTGLWITSLLFYLNNKFINGSFAFSPGR